MKHLDFAVSQIKWIAFDAVGTLIYPATPVAETYHEIGLQFGTKLSRDEVSSRFSRAFQRNESGELTEKHAGNENRVCTSESIEFVRWRQIVEDVFDDIVDVESCFRVLFDHYAKPDSWKCFDDVLPTIEKMTERGIRLSVASNFDSRLHSVFDAFDELAKIECRIVSSEVGFRKPSRRFYESICGVCGVSPESVLMVGDDLDHDLKGPRSIGMPSLLVKRQAPKWFESSSGQEDYDVINSLTKLIDILAR